MREFRRLEAALQGWPNDALTLALIAVGAFYIAVGLFAPASVKIPVLGYGVFP